MSQEKDRGFWLLIFGTFGLLLDCTVEQLKSCNISRIICHRTHIQKTLSKDQSSHNFSWKDWQIYLWSCDCLEAFRLKRVNCKGWLRFDLNSYRMSEQCSCGWMEKNERVHAAFRRSQQLRCDFFSRDLWVMFKSDQNIASHATWREKCWRPGHNTRRSLTWCREILTHGILSCKKRLFRYKRYERTIRKTEASFDKNFRVLEKKEQEELSWNMILKIFSLYKTWATKTKRHCQLLNSNEKMKK